MRRSGPSGKVDFFYLFGMGLNPTRKDFLEGGGLTIENIVDITDKSLKNIGRYISKFQTLLIIYSI